MYDGPLPGLSMLTRMPRTCGDSLSHLARVSDVTEARKQGKLQRRLATTFPVATQPTHSPVREHVPYVACIRAVWNKMDVLRKHRS